MNYNVIKLSSFRHQAGASLVLGLIILTILTVLGLVSTSGHLLQQKALAAGIEREQALHAAENALEWGEALLQTSTGAICTSNCGSANLVWGREQLPAAIEDMEADWWQQHGLTFGQDPAKLLPNQPWNNASEPPRLVITQVHQQKFQVASNNEYELRYFRVFANGYSANENNHVILSSTVAVPFPARAEQQVSADSLALDCRDAELRNAADTEYIHPDFRCGRLGWREIL